ncbi:sushi domain-containing protein 2-like [Pholidichthys leucotaenia]
MCFRLTDNSVWQGNRLQCTQVADPDGEALRDSVAAVWDLGSDVMNIDHGGQTCKGNCGGKYDSCSCHTTCTSLRNCCADYKEYCVDILPYSGSVMGGTDFTILTASFNKSSQILCRFNSNTDTVGYVDDEGSGHCISPLLYETGWIPFRISSDNGATFTRTGSWLSVHSGKLDSKFKAVMEYATKWQHYGVRNVGGTLTMMWNTSLVRAERVNIELWGYRETGEPYTEQWHGEWQFLYSLGRDQPNNGSFSFSPKPAEGGYSSWELGSVRVSPNTDPDGAWNVQAVWTDSHVLAWHLGYSFWQNSSGWALDKCLKWDQLESQLPNFLNEITDCPCTLAQARADTGRFHTDYGCDMEKGSVCTYHPGSVHCVRAIQASLKYAAGQQCCYDSTGNLVLTADSIGGSTPDRGHDWGSPPFRKPPRIPELSHWIYDVLSFYYCCLWSDNCHYYFKHRPSSDCRRYQPSSSAVVFGDPHFHTFCGIQYSFNGRGEYTLMTSAVKQLTIQGRTEPVNELVNATKLSAVAMREGSSDIIEVRLASSQSSLEVLHNQRILSFTEQTWMDLKGVFLFSPASTNVTVMFTSGAGVEVRLRGGTMATTVLLPHEFNGTTEGLLGNWNCDLVFSNGTVVLDKEQIFDFGASWAVSNESALFTYDSDYLLDMYYHSPRHDPNFIPVFDIPENPDDPLINQAAEICTGVGSDFCRYDILVGRSPAMGNATRMSYESHASLVTDLRPGSPFRVCSEFSGEWGGEETSCARSKGDSSNEPV